MSRLQTTACPTNYKFTGYERDSETGLDYAFARYYSPRLARFLSTDPLPGHVGSLQSHNAYAYVANNPLTMTDPSGMDYCDGNAFYTSGGGGTGNLPPINCFLGPGNGDPPPASGPLSPPCTIISQDLNCLGNVGQPVDSTCPPVAGANCQGHTGGGGGLSAPSWCPPGDGCDLSVPANVEAHVQQCIDEFHNSIPGQIIKFGSVFALVPGMYPDTKQNWIDWGDIMSLKAVKLGTLGGSSTELYSLAEGTTTVIPAFGSAALSFLAKAGGYGLAAATTADLAMMVGCRLGNDPAAMQAYTNNPF